MLSGTPGSSETPPDPLGSKKPNLKKPNLKNPDFKKPDLEEDSIEPIENSLLRVLVTDRSFRWAAIAVALLVGSVLVAVTPLFVVSTPEIDPPDRVSLLDKFQSRALIQTARATGLAGKLPESVTAWKTALANDPASLEARQGALELLSGAQKWTQEDVRFGYACGVELLKRSATNSLEVVRFARFLDHAGHYNATVALLRDLAARDTGELNGWFARSLFLARRMDRFEELWHRQKQALMVTDPMALIGPAWEAGWGPITGKAAARDRLLAAETDPLRHAEASQLLLMVFEQLGEATGYEQTLARRMERHEESLADHLGLWRLLARTGRSSEVMNRLKSFQRAPSSPGEATGLMEAFQAFGLADRSVELGLEQVKVFPYAPDLWLATAELLLQRQDWNRLRQIAIAMRGESSLAGRMGAYSCYLDGQIDLSLRRDLDAAADFARIAECPTPDAVLVARMVAGLRRASRSLEATTLLRRVEKEFLKDPTFWFELASVAAETQDMDTLAEAVAHSYQLEPTNPVYRHNHAAVMIALGREPAETARLTLELLNRSPESVSCQINHALALVNHQRFTDAESLLVQISWVGRTSAEETQVHYAWMLIDEARQRRDSARSHARAARESDLLPPQRQKRAAVLSGRI
jgi:predicted Zn-dependent protease